MKRCTICGANMQDNDNYCMMCGAKKEKISVALWEESENDSHNFARTPESHSQYTQKAEGTKKTGNSGSSQQKQPNINPHAKQRCPHCGASVSIYANSCPVCKKSLKTKPGIHRKKNVLIPIITAMAACVVLIALIIAALRISHFDADVVLGKTGIFGNHSEEASVAETQPQSTVTPVAEEKAPSEPVISATPTPTPFPTAVLLSTPTPEIEILSEPEAPNEDTDSSEYLLPNSDSAYLTEKDLAGYNTDQLQRMINEIYARKGFLFDYPENIAYFNSKSWYHGDTRDMTLVESRFNDYERKNVDTIRNYQNKLG